MGKFKVGDRVVFNDGGDDRAHTVLHAGRNTVSLAGDPLQVLYSENALMHCVEISKTDNVNSPSHYQSENGIECIEAIRAQLTADEFRGYIKGNIAKYVWRERTKGGDESLRKAKWYLDKLLETLADNPSV